MTVNNAQFFDARSYPAVFLKAFGTWCGHVGRSETLENLAVFAGSHPSPALAYAVGEIVEYESGGRRRFARVVGYDGEGAPAELTALRVSVAGIRGTTRLGVSPDDPEEYRARIPEELMELARSELLKDVKCPLKEECHG